MTELYEALQNIRAALSDYKKRGMISDSVADFLLRRL